MKMEKGMMEFLTPEGFKILQGLWTGVIVN
jgi:hypothetical protein